MPCLRFYYYVEGSGGAGPTMLAASFLLLGEEVVAYSKGQFQQHSTNKLFLFSLHGSPFDYSIRRSDQTEAL